MMFHYVTILDAVGTLYQEAAVRYVDLLREGKPEEAAVFNRAAEAIRKAWPDLVSKSVSDTAAG